MSGSHNDERLGDPVDLNNFPADANEQFADSTFGPPEHPGQSATRRATAEEAAAMEQGEVPPPAPPPPTARPEGQAPGTPPGGGDGPPPQIPYEQRRRIVRADGEDHAVLAALKRDLGIGPKAARHKAIDVPVDDHVFRIVSRPWEDTVWALVHSRVKPTEVEMRMEFETATVAIAVSAIDGVPVWEVFRNYIPFQFDPALFGHEDYPDTHIRHAAAEVLLWMLRGDDPESMLDARIVDQIYDAYRQHFGVVTPEDTDNAAVEPPVGDGTANPTEPSTSTETPNSE